MTGPMSVNQKLHFFSRFYFFLWLFPCLFGMILSDSTAVRAAETESALYNAKGKRDPFVQLVATSAKLSAGGILSVESIEEITIEGIVIDANPKESIVIANGSVLKEGEEVGNVKVLQIKPEGAAFSVNGVDGYKPLYQGEVKK